jgi:hypothetical protein
VSILGILREPGQDPTAFAVGKCHVNLWHLQGRAAHFLCDIGIEITARVEVQGFRVLLPFNAVPLPQDLFQKLRVPDTATLVFGEQVEVTSTEDTAILRFTTRRPPDDLVVGRINTGECRRDVHSTGDYTVWTIRLYHPLAAGTPTYYRFRFVLPSLGRTWSWKTTWPRTRNGALVDFRVNDTRDLVGRVGQLGFERELVPIYDLYVFVISPWGWQVRTVSPGLRYSRVLEGDAWLDYLGYRLSKRRGQRALVHYWRWDPKDGGDELELRACRAFIDLSRDPSVLPWINHVRWLAMIVVLGSLAFGVNLLVRNAGAVAGTLLTVLGSALGLTLLGWLLSSIGQVKHW